MQSKEKERNPNNDPASEIVVRDIDSAEKISLGLIKNGYRVSMVETKDDLFATYYKIVYTETK